MFIRWDRIKLVMSELWDPDDLTKGAGKNGLMHMYNIMCDDQGVRDAFTMLVCVQGEELFQKMAVHWRDSVHRYVDRLPTKKPDLWAQIVEMLEGRRTFLQ